MNDDLNVISQYWVSMKKGFDLHFEDINEQLYALSKEKCQHWYQNKQELQGQVSSDYASSDYASSDCLSYEGVSSDEVN